MLEIIIKSLQNATITDFMKGWELEQQIIYPVFDIGFKILDTMATLL